MARTFAQIHKIESNPITTPGVYEYGSPGARRARTYSQVIAETTRGIEAGAAMTATPQGPNGPPVSQRQAPDWRGHFLGHGGDQPPTFSLTHAKKIVAPGTLYVHRPLTNAADLAMWAKGAGIPNIVPPEEMHATQVYSRQPVSLNVKGDTITATGGVRTIGPLGDKGAVVLHFVSQDMQDRHAEALAAGASHDWPKFLTHVTLSYDAGGVDLSAIRPPSFPLIFGPEVHAAINDDWPEEKGLRKVIKAEAVNEELGLVFGWAIVCKEDGEPYFDLNIDWEGEFAGQRVPEHITEDCMLKGAFGFAATPDRPGNEMHAGPETGSFAFVWPLTGEIAKAMGITCRRTGLMVAYHPEPAVLAKFKSGEYTGFSIEGFRGHSEEHD